MARDLRAASVLLVNQGVAALFESTLSELGGMVGGKMRDVAAIAGMTKAGIKQAIPWYRRTMFLQDIVGLYEYVRPPLNYGISYECSKTVGGCGKWQVTPR